MEKGRRNRSNWRAGVTGIYLPGSLTRGFVSQFA